MSQPLRPTQPPIPSGMEMSTGHGAHGHGAGKVTVVVALHWRCITDAVYDPSAGGMTSGRAVNNL